jgi:hypothetical protein
MRRIIHEETFPSCHAMADIFDWHLPELNKHHFVALANLLSLRCGGQVEPTLLYEKIDSEHEADDNDDM